MIIDQFICKDEMPPNRMPEARYQLGVLCESITCKAADDDFCSLKFSEPPLSNCVNGTYGQVRDFCKQSCENCGTILILITNIVKNKNLRFQILLVCLFQLYNFPHMKF